MNRRLYRCRENRVLAGVASGVAEYFNLDPTPVRVVWFLSIFFGGFSLLVYVGLAIIIPLEPASGVDAHAADNQPVVEPEGHRHSSHGSGRLTMYAGFGLILLGGLALIEMVMPDWFSWRQLWPLVVIGLGGLLIAGALRRERQSTE